MGSQEWPSLSLQSDYLLLLIGSSEDVLEAKAPAGVAEAAGSIAGAVVGHDALDGNAEACVVDDGSLEEGDGAGLALGLHDAAEGDAGGIVDGDVNELPAGAAIARLLAARSSDAMAGSAEAAELFDVDVDQFAGPVTLVTARRFGRRQGAQAVEAQALEHTADGSGRDAGFGGDRLAGQALAAQPLDALDRGPGRRLVQPVGPCAAVLQACQAFASAAIDPFAHRARANADGFTDSLRRLPTENHLDHALSTERRQAGILGCPFGSPRDKLKSRNLSFLGLSRMDTY